MNWPPKKSLKLRYLRACRAEINFSSIFFLCGVFKALTVVVPKMVRIEPKDNLGSTIKQAEPDSDCVRLQKLKFSELHADAGAHHGVFAEVDVRIIVELPKPFRAVVIDTDARVPDELAGIAVSGFENCIKGNAVIRV